MKEAVSVATVESASVAPVWRPSVSRSPPLYSGYEEHLHWSHEIWMLCGRKRETSDLSLPHENCWKEKLMKGISTIWVMREIFDVFVSASSFTSSSAIRIPVTAGDLEESVSEEFETRLSWEEMAGAEECIQRVCVCGGEREGAKTEERRCPREAGGDWFHLHHSVEINSSSRELRTQQKMKQDAGSTQHFKENWRVHETQNLWITVAKQTLYNSVTLLFHGHLQASGAYSSDIDTFNSAENHNDESVCSCKHLFREWYVNLKPTQKFYLEMKTQLNWTPGSCVWCENWQIKQLAFTLLSRFLLLHSDHNKTPHLDQIGRRWVFFIIACFGLWF